MTTSYQRIPLSDAIAFSEILDPKLKTNSLRIQFLQPLSEENAAACGLGGSLIASSSKAYPSNAIMNRKLHMLYGADLSCSISKMGDVQVITLRTSSIADRYALHQEPLLQEMTDLLLTCLLQPNCVADGFTEFEFQTKQKDLLDTIEAEINEKRAYATAQALETAFQNEPAALSCYGKKEDVLALTPQNTLAAYREVLHTAPAEIYFVGAESQPMLLEKLKAALTPIDRPNVPSYTFHVPSPAKAEPVTVVEPLPVNQAKMVLVLKSDCDNRYVMQMVSYILGALPSSKLFANVREKMSLCYYCSSSYSTPKQAMIISSGVEHDNLEKAKTAILEQLTAIQNGDISDAELESARMSIYNTLNGIGDTPGSHINWYQGCYYWNNYHTPEDSLKQYLAITKEDITKAARTLKLDTVYIMDTKKEEA